MIPRVEGVADKSGCRPNTGGKFMSYLIMKLRDELIKKLSKTYEPAAMVHMHYKGKDLAFKTDHEGNPILLFIGAENEEGTVKGERYARTLKKDLAGNIIKDHWELKGKAS